MIYELKIFDYPNSYGFEAESDQIANYDFCFSGGSDFISVKLANLLLGYKGFLKEVKCLDANVIINGQSNSDYNVLNILHSLSYIGMHKPDSEPILNYLPNKSKKFHRIVFKKISKKTFIWQDVRKLKNMSLFQIS
jgi:hypothetical protein